MRVRARPAPPPQGRRGSGLSASAGFAGWPSTQRLCCRLSLILRDERKGEVRVCLFAGALHQLVEQALVLAAIVLDLHVKVEKHARLEKALELEARRCADGLDHVAAASEDDR